MEPVSESLPVEPKKSNKGLIIGIVVAVVLCCCCLVMAGAGYWLWTNGDALINSL